MIDLKKYYHLSAKLSDLKDFKESGNERGLNCGIVALNEYLTLKKGFPLFIAGAPHAGKTEFTFELLVNTSKLYGWKHFIYCGEGGDVESIFAELMHKFIGKPYNNSEFAMSKQDELKAQMFVMKHFIIANHDLEFTIDDFYRAVDECEIERDIKFDTVTFDPFNDIVEELEMFAGREDKYLAGALKKCRVNAKKHNRINIIVNHIADVRAVTDKEGNRYMPPALPNEWAGGRTWWRRAFTMLLVYRPAKFLTNDNGQPVEENETWIFIQKAKPKGVAKLGKVSIFWDWKKNQYYSRDSVGQELYSCQTKEDLKIRKLTENKDFLNQIYLPEDNPF